MRCRPIVWPRPTAGLRISCTWRLVSNRVHVAFPACVSTRAPRRWRPSRCLPIVQRRPTGAADDSPARYQEEDQPLRIPGRAPPVAPSPILRRFGHATARYVNQSTGSPHRLGTASATCRRSPPPSHPAGDSTPIMSVKGTYSGEIEKSQSRSGNCDSRPGNAISRELTSLNHTKQSSDT